MWTQYRELLDRAVEIEAAWRAEGNTCDAFADIAWERTTGLDLSAFGEIANVPELLEVAAISSLQHPSTFSDLYFKLFDNGKFWVEILNWWGSDINVHDHNFSGVQFQLRGRSLNVAYAFVSEIFMPGLAVGDLRVDSAEVWEPGDRSIVRPGTASSHNVIHLSVPTVSLIIRTHPSSAYGGQNNYLPPDIAADYAVADIAFRKKIATLRLLAQRRDPQFVFAFEHVLNHHTHCENLFTILKLIDLVFVPDYVGLVHKYASRGEVETLIVRAAAYHRAQQVLTNGVKYAPGLTADEILAVSVLAAAFSEESLSAIIGHLKAAGRTTDVTGLLAVIHAKLDTDLQRQLHSALELFGIRSARETTLSV